MVSTLLFDDESEVLHDRVSIDQIGKMTDEQYYVRGCTALLDAVGGAISHIGNIHKYARKEDRPEKTIFIITTDGVSMAVCSVMSANSKKEVSECLSESGWNTAINEDYQKRGKKRR